MEFDTRSRKKTDLIFLLNNATVVEKNAIATLLKSDRDIAIPKILVYSSLEVIWGARVEWRKYPPALKMQEYLEIDRGQYDASVEPVFDDEITRGRSPQ